MDRRRFLAYSGLAASARRWRLPLPPRDDLYPRLVAWNDTRVDSLLERQQLDPDHPWCGGVPDRHGIYAASGAAGLVRDLASAWVAPESRHTRSPLLLTRLRAAARCLLTVQHDDGTIDLPTTNFHSPPDTAFALRHVCGALRVLRDDGHDDSAAVRADLLGFVERGAGALVVGGIHTPNHRWVVCMALARAHDLAPDERYLKRIDQWLGEKIDIDPDGQFTEHSTTIYSPLTDRCLLTVARVLDRPALLEPVRRNLEMTLYYLHADGEVVTEASRRQDQYRRGSPWRYHYPYRYLALRDGNGRFAAAARMIEAREGRRLVTDLVRYLEDPDLRRPLPASAPLPTRYTKLFAHSQLVRIRRGGASATLLADNATFFSLHRGRAAVVVRMASAFFGKGQFEGDGPEPDDGGWLLKQELEGPYYQPLPVELLPGDGDWNVMDRDQRPQSGVQHQRATVHVEEHDGAFALELMIEGTAGVPVAVELGFRSGGTLHGVEPIEDADRSWLLAGEQGRYELEDDTISFGPGRAEHRWTELRGALSKLDADCVYLTGFTPFHARLRLS